MFLNISIHSLLKNKWLWLFVSLIVIVCAVLIYNCAEKLVLGKKLAIKATNLFEAKSYYAVYEMTVISNKNVNTYFVKEWFDSDKHRFEFLDKMNNVVEIIVNKEKIFINNVNEKNKLTLNNLNYGNNIMSFSTLMDMYHCTNNVENKCECNISQYEKDGKITACVELGNDKECQCNVCQGIVRNQVTEIVVEIDGISKTPLGFTVYDKDKNVISSIVYTKFEINVEIDEGIFAIS